MLVDLDEDNNLTTAMQLAIEEAKKSASEGGIPIGAVLVRDGTIIGAGHNRRVQDDDPIMHAEINCLKNAGRLPTYENTVLYSTLMPCYFGRPVIQFRIPHVIVGEARNFPGATELLRLPP